jgi:thiol-disulfide isomerase/thioredoxin
MDKNRPERGVILALGLSLATYAPAFSEDRTPDKILADLKSVELPAVPADLRDRDALRAFNERARVAIETRSVLIGELFNLNPEHPKLSSLLTQRWSVLQRNPETLPKLQAETSWVLSNSKNESLVNDAYFYKALASIRSSSIDPKAKDVPPEIEAFALRSPKDARLASLLVIYAHQLEDPESKERIFKRIEKDFPNTPSAKEVVSARARIEGQRRRLERIGKPFELEFTEVSKGTPITMASLKGKVVVIDFWATWCGPCVAEMPNMKKLYAEFKDKGVEFIGVSLDLPKEDGGLDKLKDYVASNGIEWPQYYQGNWWRSEFSSSWEVHAIPCVFLVDADGNLATVDARGRLESLIPEYLEKARSKGTTKTTATP